MTSILFAFQNLLRCASWPVRHENHSPACPALVLRAGRAEKWQLLMGQQAWGPSKQGLFCTSKNPWGKGAEGKQSSLPLQTGNGKESPRAPWRYKSSRQEARYRGPEEP